AARAALGLTGEDPLKACPSEPTTKRLFFDAKKPPPIPLSPNAIRPFIAFLTFFEKYFSMLA
ncbi:hypothetical protein, partial [Pseudomonas sp. NBRC 111133]|uniref:hypothetical protein n=1 Tax=Pseudomonas sp. NBRC 111133 TaxID=1661048 RepID=UPI001C4442D7